MRDFGWSVAVSGDTALVGATGDEGNTGAVYVFERAGTILNQQAKLTAPDAGAGLHSARRGSYPRFEPYPILTRY